MEAAYDAGIRYFDTSPWYGNGKSEHRLGHTLQEKPLGSYVLSTKVGRLFHRPTDVEALRPSLRGTEFAFAYSVDYSCDGVMRSYEDSLQRLGVPRVDALLIHDLDRLHFPTEEGLMARFDQLESGGGYAALQELKQSGEIKAIGVGINRSGMVPLFLERFAIDFFLIAMPYTLLDQDALDEDLPLCEEHGASVVIGAVFSSGILTDHPSTPADYGYQPAPTSVLEKASRIREICHRHGVSLPAAALQFPLAHPAVASVIPGAVSPAQVQQNVEHLRAPIPADLWLELKANGLLHPDATTP